MTERLTCVATEHRVIRGDRRPVPCGRPACSMRDGRPYCRDHDPDAGVLRAGRRRRRTRVALERENEALRARRALDTGLFEAAMDRLRAAERERDEEARAANEHFVAHADVSRERDTLAAQLAALREVANLCVRQQLGDDLAYWTEEQRRGFSQSSPIGSALALADALADIVPIVDAFVTRRQAEATLALRTCVLAALKRWSETNRGEALREPGASILRVVGVDAFEEVLAEHSRYGNGTPAARQELER